jgi:hypothetical protein
VTRGTANELPDDTSEITGHDDQAHEIALERPAYRVRPSDDGGTWRGPTEAAWMTRLLRGARPPRESPGMPTETLPASG